MTLYEFEGERPEIHPDAWIAPDANVIGRIRIASGASVWFGATLRGDNEWVEIGEETNLQEQVVCHTDMGFPLTIGARCTIGHKAMLHGCRIGEETLVGMGATILNGAVIGRHCLIGAGALVTERKEIPDGSLVIGSPAKVVRSLDEEAISALRRSASGYSEKAKRFRSSLVAL